MNNYLNIDFEILFDRIKYKLQELFEIRNYKKQDVINTHLWSHGDNFPLKNIKLLAGHGISFFTKSSSNLFLALNDSI